MLARLPSDPFQPWAAFQFPLPVVPPRFTPLTAAAQNRRLASKLYADFFAWPIERSIRILETTPAEVWEREGQKRALQVFHAAIRLQHQAIKFLDSVVSSGLSRFTEALDAPKPCRYVSR